MKVRSDIPAPFYGNIEELKGRNDPEALKAVAGEMEALFAYELIKSMRATVGSAEKSFGSDTYMSMFDMELAKLFAQRGLGLKDVLLKGMERLPQDVKAGKGPQRTTPDLKNETPAMKNTDPVPTAVSAKTESGNAGHHDPFVTKSREACPALPVKGRISSQFGMRIHPVYGGREFHGGIDIAAPAGTKVHPYKPGKVIFSGVQAGYGNVVIVDHGNGYISKYGHNKVNLVKSGDQVGADTVISLVGSTGLSTGPHLHFEIVHNGKKINPGTVLALK